MQIRLLNICQVQICHRMLVAGMTVVVVLVIFMDKFRRGLFETMEEVMGKIASPSNLSKDLTIRWWLIKLMETPYDIYVPLSFMHFFIFTLSSIYQTKTIKQTSVKKLYRMLSQIMSTTHNKIMPEIVLSIHKNINI